MLSPPAVQQRTVATSGSEYEASAIACMMAYTGGIPHVVHGPYHPFPHSAYPAYFPERQHALIDPIEHHHIGLPHKRMLRQRQAVGSNRHRKKILAGKAIRSKNSGMLRQKGYLFPQAACSYMHAIIIAGFMHHKHRYILAHCHQSLEQTHAHNRGSATAIAMVYNHYLHRRCRNEATGPRSDLRVRCSVRAKNATNTTRSTARSRHLNTICPPIAPTPYTPAI